MIHPNNDKYCIKCKNSSITVSESTCGWCWHIIYSHFVIENNNLKCRQNCGICDYYLMYILNVSFPFYEKIVGFREYFEMIANNKIKTNNEKEKVEAKEKEKEVLAIQKIKRKNNVRNEKINFDINSIENTLNKKRKKIIIDED